MRDLSLKGIIERYKQKHSETPSFDGEDGAYSQVVDTERDCDGVYREIALNDARKSSPDAENQIDGGVAEERNDDEAGGRDTKLGPTDTRQNDGARRRRHKKNRVENHRKESAGSDGKGVKGDGAGGRKRGGKDGADVATTVDNDSEREKDFLPEEGEIEETKQRKEFVDKLSFFFSIIGNLYAIGSTCFILANRWVNAVAGFVLIALLCVYVVVLVALVIRYRVNARRGKRTIRLYGWALKLFKGVVTLTYFGLTVVSMTAMYAAGDMQAGEFAVFIISFIVAVVQIALKIASIVLSVTLNAVSKKFKVEMHRYVDGQKQKLTAAQNAVKHTYRRAEKRADEIAADRMERKCEKQRKKNARK